MVSLRIFEDTAVPGMVYCQSLQLKESHGCHQSTHTLRTLCLARRLGLPLCCNRTVGKDEIEFQTQGEMS